MAMEETPNPVGKPLAFPTVELLQEAVTNYFKKCDLEARPYTMSGLANSVGVDRGTILNYSKKEEYFSTIKEARAKVEQYAEEKLYGSAVTGVIFNLKNNFGWQDGQNVNLGGQFGNNPIQSEQKLTPEQLEALKQFTLLKNGLDPVTV